MTPRELQRWRRENRHSLQSLADALGYEYRQIIRWEQGKVPVPKAVELALKSGAVPARDESKIGRWPKKG